ACEGTLACSTCHLIFTASALATLSPPTDEELDMLDLAHALTPTSRLGCQICLSASLDGLRVQVPSDVSDIRQQLN
ncbi:adrenodoxin, mitochondrial-like, partial [Lampetra fluviatilis]